MDAMKRVALFLFIIGACLLLAACQVPPAVQIEQVAPTVGVQPATAPVVDQPAAPISETASVNTVGAASPESDQTVTLNMNLPYGDPMSLDPSLAADGVSVNLVDNLFVGLTDIRADGSVAPALATDWSVSDDRLTYTFNLRDDATWVRYTAAAGVQQLGPVTAYDVVYGVKRTCDPRTAATSVYLDYVIAGCHKLNAADPARLSEQEVQALIDNVGVSAPDSTTVQFTLNTQAVYFPQIAGLWVNRPQNRTAIEENGNHWTNPGQIVTNGPYLLARWFHYDDMTLEKNPFWYGWDEAAGNIERIELRMTTDQSLAFKMYKFGTLDTDSVPAAEIDHVKSDPVLSQEYVHAPEACTSIVGFTNSKPPLDNVLVRKALAAAIDRQSLIDSVLKGNEIPANTFAPGMVFGSPAGDPDIAPWALPESMGGWGYDKSLAQAREWLAEAGYPDGQGFPAITFMHSQYVTSDQVMRAIQSMWADGLGIEVAIESTEHEVFYDTIDANTPLDERPNAWTLVWCADYADENNWVYEVFNSDDGTTWASWDATANAPLGPQGMNFNQLTKDAQQVEDPTQRLALYRAAEKISGRRCHGHRAVVLQRSQ